MCGQRLRRFRLGRLAFPSDHHLIKKEQQRQLLELWFSEAEREQQVEGTMRALDLPRAYTLPLDTDEEDILTQIPPPVGFKGEFHDPEHRRRRFRWGAASWLIRCACSVTRAEPPIWFSSTEAPCAPQKLLLLNRGYFFQQQLLLLNRSSFSFATETIH